MIASVCDGQRLAPAEGLLESNVPLPGVRKLQMWIERKEVCVGNGPGDRNWCRSNMRSHIWIIQSCDPRTRRGREALEDSLSLCVLACIIENAAAATQYGLVSGLL